jgi:hypothetical protein
MIEMRDDNHVKAIEGIYRGDKVELLETPPDVTGARIVVTFLTEGEIDAPINS